MTEAGATISAYSISGLEIGATYAISFGKYTNASSTNLAITGGDIIYQNRDSSGGTYGANYGIAIIKTTSTTINQSSQMNFGSKIYRIS